MRIFFFLVMLAVTGIASAQTIERRVIAATGGNFTNTSFSASYTVGEMAVTYLVGTSYTASQGFQQNAATPNNSRLSQIAPDKSEQLTETEFLLYPNPVSQELFFITGKNAGISRITLVNSAGVVLDNRKPAPSLLNSFNMTHYSSGLYLIKVEKEDGKVIIRKIIKD
jgi:hypothetical protein